VNENLVVPGLRHGGSPSPPSAIRITSCPSSTREAEPHSLRSSDSIDYFNFFPVVLAAVEMLSHPMS
jgi:hypothetical protein